MKPSSYNSMIYGIVLFVFLSSLLAKVVDSFSPTTVFHEEVVRFLEENNVAFQDAKLPHSLLSAYSISRPPEILELIGTTTSVALHLIPTPKKIDESLPPKFKKDITDWIKSTRSDEFPPKVIHLHEDVWINKNEIVRGRLLVFMGQSRQRIFARKTTSHRINATTAMNFLEEHHLWGATRAKYYYGLFVGEELEAVATFSSRRKILRDNRPHRSHELLRFCAKRNSNVVGGISKLLKIFTLQQKPDDIVTIIDRDWGDGSGWHSVGFETVCTCNPIVMVVNPNEPGLRRQLVGAGISSSDNDNIIDKGRMGLPEDILVKLESLKSAEDVLQVLSSHNYFPVYDAGVERLLKLVNTSADESTEISVIGIWKKSSPTYAADYYSSNPGIASLLRHAASAASSGP